MDVDLPTVSSAAAVQRFPHPYRSPARAVLSLAHVAGDRAITKTDLRNSRQWRPKTSSVRREPVTRGEFTCRFGPRRRERDRHGLRPSASRFFCPAYCRDVPCRDATQRVHQAPRSKTTSVEETTCRTAMSRQRVVNFASQKPPETCRSRDGQSHTERLTSEPWPSAQAACHPGRVLCLALYGVGGVQSVVGRSPHALGSALPCRSQGRDLGL
jgi:hypothetical protein